ncbi:ribosome quality control complex subunit TCF25 isoform X1 [Prorops nasuta]|uniref:ribosome quality control complex subunit TCF25 isoform X1 n=1 Tax=Prorops nasuta TaxID=863751 RepID=UPI0034CD0E35
MNFQMSTRYIKKVYGKDLITEKDNESFTDLEIPTNGIKAKLFNVYDLLNQNSGSENEENEIEQEIDNGPSTSQMHEAKSKKKKRKHKKVDKDQQLTDSNLGENIDEIERTVREVNKLLGEPMASCSNENPNSLQWVIQKSKETILSVQHKHLNPYNELKRIFGSKTIQAEQSKRRNRGRSSHLKKTWLISARESWPPIGKSGLSMAIDHSMESDGDIKYFVYEHSPSYRQMQIKFLQAVESLNPENVTNIINTHYYHVDALLQLAELCKLGEDLPMAAEFTEKALYCLECAFHPLFNMTTAQCRLDYRKQQNRALYITLFKHLDFVGGRACYRTSLEFCKLLLSLDPDGDPLAVVLCLDFYALRSREYEWFIQYCDLWDKTRNLTQLPNIAYSLALAHFYLGNKETSDELLQNALIMFPGVLIPLLEKCCIQPDSKVLGHNYFNSTAKATTSSLLEKLQDLYTIRSFHLWKEASILPWLERGVNSVLSRVDAKDDYVKYCQVKRSKRYQGKLPRNILRHILLADIKELAITANEAQSDGPVLSHDPFPPSDTIDIYVRPVANPRAIQNNSNLFSLFFSSLFTDIDGDVVAAAYNTAAAALNALNLFDENDEEQQQQQHE